MPLPQQEVPHRPSYSAETLASLSSFAPGSPAGFGPGRFIKDPSRYTVLDHIVDDLGRKFGMSLNGEDVRSVRVLVVFYHRLDRILVRAQTHEESLRRFWNMISVLRRSVTE